METVKLTTEDRMIFLDCLKMPMPSIDAIRKADRADASIMLKAQNDPKFPYADGKQVRNS